MGAYADPKGSEYTAAQFFAAPILGSLAEPLQAPTMPDQRQSMRAFAVLLAVLVLGSCGAASVNAVVLEPLPVRAGPRTETTYTVPHVQVFVDPVPAVDDALRRRMFALPDVERRESISSIKGAEGLWLGPGAPEPNAVLRQREFAHIHPDGSLHLVLPLDRAREAIETKWAEFHPWVGSEDMWDGMVMLYTPQSDDEAAVTLQLIVESYNFVTGRSITVEDIS